jgi:hypothetical protein
MDIGLDARFLNNRLNFTVDYFDKRTKDLLVSVRPPLEVGVESVTMNAGEISNKGFEFEAGWRDRAGDFRYSINANFATLKNKVTYVDPTAGRVRGTGFAQLKTSTYFEEGYPLWYINGYKFTGVDDATGDPTFLDVDSDGVIGDADLVDLGSGMPDYTYGMTVNLAYKGFDLTLFGMGVGGNEIYSYIHRTDRPMTNAMSKFFKERWTENNKTASLPRPGGANEYEFWSSSANVFNGSYFKIKQIQLGYSIPESVTRKVMVSNLRVYVSLDDFVTITKYPGFDPEVASSNTTSGLGLDMGSFPISKKILFGVNISF